MSEIVYYDLARRGDRNTSWTANVWKTRLVLNYKKLPYRTEWLNHSNIESTLSGLGIPPNTSGKGSAYTVPTVTLPDGDTYMDSAVIVEKLEALHPSPSLHLESGMQDKAAQVVGAIGFPLLPNLLPRIARDVLVESTVDGYREKRKAQFGMSLEELEATKGGEKAWEACGASGLPALKALLTENKKDDGPFILGSQVCYGDFLVMALFEGLRRAAEDMFERVVAYDQSFAKLYEACKVWTERDT